MVSLRVCILIVGNMIQQAYSQFRTPEVYQPDKDLCVNIGDLATLQCCIFGKSVGVVTWYKQPNGKQPQIIANVFKTSLEIFHSQFQNPRFQLKRSSNCSRITISDIGLSDESMYYCAIVSPYVVFGNGTYLKVKETSNPARCDHSVVCEPTRYGNSTHVNAHANTVLGLGTALGVCALLIFCLIYFILRRRKWDKMNGSIEDSAGTRCRRESEAETLNYAALQFSKRKAKAEKRKPGSSDCVSESLYTECAYSFVK